MGQLRTNRFPPIFCRSRRGQQGSGKTRDAGRISSRQAKKPPSRFQSILHRLARVLGGGGIASRFMSRRRAKHQAPNPKLQRSSNSQAPNPKNRHRGKRCAGWCLSLGSGVWGFFGFWCLEFFAWALSFSKIETRERAEDRPANSACAGEWRFIHSSPRVHP